MEGYDHILEHDKVGETDFVPNTIEDFHDTKKVIEEFFSSESHLRIVTDHIQIFGEHYARLLELKRRYDPGNKLKGPIKPDV